MLETSLSLTTGHDSLLVTSYLRLRGPRAAGQPAQPRPVVIPSFEPPAPPPRFGAGIDRCSTAVLPLWLRGLASLQLDAEPVALR